MQNTNQSYDGWIGNDAYDSAGEKVGEITDIFYDDKTGRPEWLAVRTGLFGSKHTFVPIHGSQLHRSDEVDDHDQDSLRLAFNKAMIKDAPRIDADSHMTPLEEQELWAYYGYDYQSDLADHGYGSRYSADRADKDFTYTRRDVGAIGNVGTERLRRYDSSVSH